LLPSFDHAQVARLLGRLLFERSNMESSDVRARCVYFIVMARVLCPSHSFYCLLRHGSPERPAQRRGRDPLSLLRQEEMTKNKNDEVSQ